MPDGWDTSAGSQAGSGSEDTTLTVRIAPRLEKSAS